MAVYSTMLEHMSDEQKITVTAKLAQEVLSAAIEGGLPLASTSGSAAPSDPAAFLSGNKKSACAEARKKASAVVKDALTIMASPGIRVGGGRGGAAATGDVDDGSGKTRIVYTSYKILLGLNRTRSVEEGPLMHLLVGIVIVCAVLLLQLSFVRCVGASGFFLPSPVCAGGM